MRLKVKVVVNSPLRIRSGAGTSFSIVGRLQYKDEVIVNNSKSFSGWEWYYLEDKRGWVCKREPGAGADYIKVIEDLEPKKDTPVTENTIPPPKPVDPGNHNTVQPNVVGENIINSAVIRGDTNTQQWHEEVEKKKVENNSRNRSIFVQGASDYTEDDLNSDMGKIRRNMDISFGGGGFFNGLMPLLFSKFNRFRVAFPDEHLERSFSTVVFTRPDLNLVTSKGEMTYQANNTPMYNYVWQNNAGIINQLTKFGDSSHQFMAYLNHKASSFEISDEFIKPVEHGETFTGNKILYGKHDIESKAAGEFSITYTDDKNLNIYRTHKIWLDYISRVYRGQFIPRDEYKREKILDYACSAYYFICGADGETILFWSKFYGVFPTNTPSSTLSWAKDSILSKPEMSISYSYSFKEDFDPISLIEFNTLSTSPPVDRKMYEATHVSTGSTFVNAPFIKEEVVRGQKVFKLKWRD